MSNFKDLVGSFISNIAIMIGFILLAVLGTAPVLASAFVILKCIDGVLSWWWAVLCAIGLIFELALIKTVFEIRR